MDRTLQDLTRQLLALSKSASEEKVLPQEMKLIQQKAFEVQEQMMTLLDQQEKETKDIKTIQNIYQIREDVWDIMNHLAVREAEIKAKFGIKGESPEIEQSCCQHHHDGNCCCHAHHKKKCCENKKDGNSKEKKKCLKK